MLSKVIIKGILNVYMKKKWKPHSPRSIIWLFCCIVHNSGGRAHVTFTPTSLIQLHSESMSVLYRAIFNSSPPPGAAYMCQINMGSDNGSSPIRRQAIIYTNHGLLSIGPLGTNVSKILIKVQNRSFTKMHLKISSVEWRPFCPEGEMS